MCAPCFPPAPTPASLTGVTVQLRDSGGCQGEEAGDTAPSFLQAGEAFDTL